MKVSIDKKKSEAISRMKSLGIFPETIRQFSRGGKINISEPPLGVFYWANDDELNEIREFECKHNALVYLIVRSFTSIGTMDSYLYVSDHENEWEDDREDITDSILFTYTINRDDPQCSEFGSIGFKRSPAAGILRTW